MSRRNRLTLAEQETIILWDNELDTANVYTHDQRIANKLKELEKKYPNIDLEKTKEGKGWHVIIPDFYRNGHEAHFGQVTENFLKYLVDGKLPEWEVPNMIAKYYVTTQALKMALEK